MSRRALVQLAATGLLSASCRLNPVSRIVIFHAGSLARLVIEMSRRFQDNEPRTRIESESSGSLDAIRKITDLNRPCDLLMTADHRLLERGDIFPRPVSSVQLVGNEMVLASGLTRALREDRQQWVQDWPHLVLGYRFGISDPARDPAGYFAHLVWKLTEIQYNQPGFYQAISRRFDTRWMRPKSSELVALLQTGALDFAFLYRSTALQNNLSFVDLPPQVSLGDPAYSQLYARVSFRIPALGERSAVEIRGAPIRAGVALLEPSNRAARLFLSFLTRPENQLLYEGLGYRSIPGSKMSSGR